MNRRYFLQGAGVLLTSGGGLRQEAQASPKKERRILITSGESELAQVIADHLGRDYRIRLTGLTAAQSDFLYTRCELGHDSATDELVRGVEAIVHVAEPPPDANEEEQLDHQTRKTYNLLRAATQEGVRRLVFLSTLELMTGYDEAFLVRERWRPLPPTQMSLLAKYLGEYTCREFAREEKIQVIVLRIGKVVKAAAVKGQTVDPLWVEEREVAQAVAGALDVELSDHAQGVERWRIFHVQSEFPGARFPVGGAKGALGYQPWFKPQRREAAGKGVPTRST